LAEGNLSGETLCHPAAIFSFQFAFFNFQFLNLQFTRRTAMQHGVHLAKRSPTVKTLLSEEDLRGGVEKLAHLIRSEYGGGPLTIVGILTGSLVLLADLIRLLDMPLRVGVLQASSYRGGVTRSDLRINSEMMLDLQGRDVLLVDDIFDTGHTLATVMELLLEYQPASLRAAVLLRKEGRQEVLVEPNFVAFDIPDKFVVGYGLDYRDQYRNLRYLAVLECDDIEERRDA
jgi:hypoxanthine phosphoribosyltransferase